MGIGLVSGLRVGDTCRGYYIPSCSVNCDSSVTIRQDGIYSQILQRRTALLHTQNFTL